MYFYLIFALCVLLQCLHIEAIWEFDNAPGVAMEYKMHIDPGKEDCYWQYVHEGASFYVNMQVINGGDGMAGMAIRNTKNEVIHPYVWQQSDEFEGTAPVAGHYSICIDNSFSRYSSKLINLYLTTFRHDLWEKHTKELEDLHVSVDSFTVSIKKIDKDIHYILQYQSIYRSKEGRHYKLLLDNNSYIQYWSIAQCLAVIACSAMQVYSLRKLFETKRTKSGTKA